MIRRLVRLFCVVTTLAIAPLALASVWREGGYANRSSVPQGGTITFRIATSVSPFSLEIVNLARPTQVLAMIPNLTSTAIECQGLWETGCGWPATTQFTVPSAWPSGYYAARFPTSGGTRYSFFVVRAANPGLTSPIVVVVATNTYQAYNQFGGKSVYDSISTNGKRAHTVSFDRPYFDNLGLGRYPAWDQPFVDWMTSENRPFEVITDDDLADPTILGNYQLALLIGHSEYWTLEAREELESFSRDGGNIAVFGGNTMWWQSRVNFATRQFTVYKDAALDPMTGVDDDVVTVNFYDHPVFNPENFILGSSFRHGGYANVVPGGFEALPVADRTPYTVVKASDWAFAGTSLTNGGTFGQAAAGTEVDGVVFNTLPSGELVVDGSDGTPLNFQILATIPGGEGYGVIGYYVNPQQGVVFNVGTRDWTRGLPVDTIVRQLTRNVLDTLSSYAPLPYVPRTSPWLVEEWFNTPVPMPDVMPGWSGGLRQASVASSCAQEGPAGLRMEGTEWTQLIRNFAPDDAGISTATAEFQLNADALTDTPNFAMPVVELIDEVADDITIYAAVEMQKRSGLMSIRLSLYRANGTRSGSTAWAAMPAGWQKATLTWRSPGTCVLEVGSGIRLEMANAETGQQVREVMLEFAGSGLNATGALCIDALRLRESVGALAIDAPPNANAGIAFNVTVTTASHTGTVHFTSNDGAATLPGDYTFVPADNGVRTFTVTLRTPGDRTITVTDGTLTASAIVHVTGTTTTSLVSSRNPAHPGEEVTFTATVTPSAASGTVTFRDGSTVIGTATVSSGTASIARSNLSSGTHTISATYSGDANCTSSTSMNVTQIITFAPPASVDAVTVTATKVAVSWAAVPNVAAYRVERSFNNGPYETIATTSSTSIEDLSVTANKSYLYRVLSLGPGGAVGLPGLLDIATTKVFTADPQRRIRASHVTDLRQAINALRTSAGLAPASYSTPTIAPGTRVRASDITEMRTAVNAARTALGLAPFVFTDVIAARITVIKWIHWRELQMAAGALAAP
jgi:Bacterial Ig-like domain (group 3)